MNNTASTLRARAEVKNLKKPEVLYLMWKPKNEIERFKVGELYEDKFQYVKNLTTPQQHGFTKFSLFDIDKIHSNALRVFMSRCPPKNRVDYNKFLQAFALPLNKEIDDFTLLGYTGAYLPDDNFHLLNPFQDIEPPFEFTMQISRFHISDCKDIDKDNLKGKVLEMQAEPTNISDENAIQLKLDGKIFGYIQRVQNICFLLWQEKGWNIDIEVFHINGSPEQPCAYAFVSVTK